jgi:6-pyruvoyl-tetrahydropterin synthase
MVLEIGSRVLSQGMVVDYKNISTSAKHIVNLFDHQMINDFLTNPTAELIATYCSQTFIRQFRIDHPSLVFGKELYLIAVEISETANTNCRYEVNEKL